MPAQKRVLMKNEREKMSIQLNRVQVVGNLTRDPELRLTTENNPVVEFSLGVNERLSNGQGKEPPRQITTFLDVQVWGKAAENLSKLAKKGQEMFVEGSLRQSNWKEADTGKTRSKIFVRAESWQFTQHKGPEKTPEQGIER
jgi:single-strand DNA-binding protein